jgi:hypothetical protein
MVMMFWVSSRFVTHSLALVTQNCEAKLKIFVPIASITFGLQFVCMVQLHHRAPI